MSAHRWAVLLFVALLCLPSSSRAASAERGIAAYEEGDYPTAIEALSSRLGLGVADLVERTRLRAFLASAHLARKDRDASRALLGQMLDEDPSLALDNTVFPPALLQLLDEVRRERFPPPVPTPAPTPASPPPPSAAAPAPVAPAALGLAFLPLGGGQFANDQPIKGTVFLILEAAAFGTAGVSLGMFEASKQTDSGGVLGGGRFDDPDRANRLQNTYLVSFWSGVALVALGVGDALLSRQGSP